MNEREWQRDQFIMKHRGKGVPIKMLSRMFTSAWKAGSGDIKQVDRLAFSMLCGYTMALSNDKKRRKAKKRARRKVSATA